MGVSCENSSLVKSTASRTSSRLLEARFALRLLVFARQSLGVREQALSVGRRQPLVVVA